MNDVSLVFPHQLFANHPALSKTRPVAIIEDELFFRQYPFHKQKILLHRSSMKAFENNLHNRGFHVLYFSSVEFPTLQSVFAALVGKGFGKLHVAAPEDYLLEKRLRRLSIENDMHVQYYQTPGFICTTDYLEEFFSKKQKYFLTDFYIAQRKRFHLLMDNGNPAGGKWTYDTENRRKLPGSVRVPSLPLLAQSTFVKDGANYVFNNFSHHYGDAASFNYPVTHDQAIRWLDAFLTVRFEHYGIYQDAIAQEDSFLFHSVLTPALNIGLLTPDFVVERAIDFARQKKIALNSVEGFVRQIIGWREFVRALYTREGVYQRTRNFWDHHINIPPAFWNGTTGIPPIDHVIHKLLRTSYSNHIERLMVIGNFMLLCEFHPDEVYQWFMTLYIDAYDWVMVPNVYGMSQFADGGLMSTKPYISGSNYIMKMSNVKKGEWCEIWDALYWSFIDKHRHFFLHNPRMSMMVKLYDKMDTGKQKKIRSIPEKFLSQWR